MNTLPRPTLHVLRDGHRRHRRCCLVAVGLAGVGRGQRRRVDVRRGLADPHPRHPRGHRPGRTVRVTGGAGPPRDRHDPHQVRHDRSRAQRRDRCDAERHGGRPDRRRVRVDPSRRCARRADHVEPQLQRRRRDPQLGDRADADVGRRRRQDRDHLQRLRPGRPDHRDADRRRRLHQERRPGQPASRGQHPPDPDRGTQRRRWSGRVRRRRGRRQPDRLVPESGSGCQLCRNKPELQDRARSA